MIIHWFSEIVHSNILIHFMWFKAFGNNTTFYTLTCICQCTALTLPGTYLYINNISQTLLKISTFLAKILGGRKIVFLVILNAEKKCLVRRNQTNYWNMSLSSGLIEQSKNKATIEATSDSTWRQQLRSEKHWKIQGNWV